MTEEMISISDDFEVVGIRDEKCRLATKRAIDAIIQRLPNNGAELLRGVKIEIGHNLTKSGGEADITTKHIVLDAEKNARSLQSVEDELVAGNILEPDDWVVVLPDSKDEPWSTLSYNIVHELGHLVGGKMSAEFTPTKYGQDEDGEAFSEAFTYWVYGKPLSLEAEKAIKAAVGKNWGEL